MGKKNQKLKEKASLARKAIANGTQNSKNKSRNRSDQPH